MHSVESEPEGICYTEHMRIDGTALADSILTKLSETVLELKEKDITPKIAVILVGDDPGSISYIKQKEKAAKRIGAILTLEHLPVTISPETLLSTITHYNNDPDVHGLIVQRPLPIVGVDEILNSISPIKDVDGFVPHSPHEVPVARGVISFFEYIHSTLIREQLVHGQFKSWLNEQSITIVGHGETAGKPISDILKKYDCHLSILTSKNSEEEKNEAYKHSSAIISCVGKQHILTRKNIPHGVMLMSVGLTRGTDGKLHGDYEESDIEKIASFYTPTPGGIGPVNVACLMRNLVDAAIMMSSRATTS
jgi:methylenetetrahydrofolate dehydrogenase (NADP+) / methenyltetrahydrofolate cyclohydrolase